MKFQPNTRILKKKPKNAYIFVADIDDPLLLRVLDPEFVGEGLQHYTSLYEIVKVDVSGTASIKHSDYSVTELGGSIQK